MTSPKDSEFFYFRSEFDKTLKQYFREVMDLSVLPSGLSLNIPVISCLILLVEREKEIQDFPQSPPERYTRDSFIDDIETVGVGVDRIIFDTIEDLISFGFINATDKDVRPSETAFKIVNFINNLFPGMTGINFVAYLVQTIDEVYSDRKSLAEGKEVFYQTLRSRSAGKKSVSEDAVKALKKEAPKETQGVSSKALKERLSQLRKSRQAQSSDDELKKMKVKSVFGKPGAKEEKKEEFQEDAADLKEEPSNEEKSAEEIPAEEIKKEEAEQVFEKDSQSEISEKEDFFEKDSESNIKEEKELADEKIQSDEKQITEEPDLKEPEKEEKIEESVQAEEKPEPAQAAPEIKEPDLKQEEKIPEPEKENSSEDAVGEADINELTDEEIEQRVSRFEQDLAMTCPVCNDGKVTDSVTGKGKTYYQCTNNVCHFISWAKPFHYQCPVCKNPFLVETVMPDGSKGLKCPRATCDYQQDDQKSPESRQTPKKKKKVVRRVKKKK
jgi:hypothetical protein